MTSSGQGRGRGYAYALGAYTIWGLIPAYFKLLTKAPPLELRVQLAYVPFNRRPFEL